MQVWHNDSFVRTEGRLGPRWGLGLSAAFAVPVEMTHQGELLNLDGSAVTGSHVLSFKIYGEESGGASLAVAV